MQRNVNGLQLYTDDGAACVHIGSGTATILQTTTAVAIGTAVSATGGRTTIQAVATGAGTLTATVLIQVSNDGTNFLTLATISLNSVTPAQDGFVMDAPWAYIRSNVTALAQSSGSDKSITITMGA